MINEPVLVFSHGEKIIRFPDNGRFGLVIRAFAVDKFTRVIEPFAIIAVESFVFAEIDIPGVVDLCENMFYNRNVVGIGCPDKPVVIDADLGPDFPEQAADPVRIGLRTFIVFFGRFYDFITVFVRAGQEKRFFFAHIMETAGNIGCNGCVGMPQVGFRIDVINGGCHIKCHF